MGWSGPAVLYTGTSAPPACGAAWPNQPAVGGLAVTSPQATCSTCSCDPPGGINCQPPATIAYYADLNCQQLITTLQVGFGNCNFGPPDAMSIRMTSSMAVAGTCQAAGGQANLPPASFSTQASLCDMPPAVGVGCGGGACVPAPPPGFAQAICIYQTGDVTCPTGPYTQKTLLYGGIAEGRTCSPCMCGPASGATCADEALVFGAPVPNGGGCNPPQQMLPASAGCIRPPDQYVSGVVDLGPNGPPIGGSCQASGGIPVGSATGAMPTTVCCM